jgi:hypothetical protein
MKILVMQSSALPCYLISLRPKYPPQHPIIENPQPTFLPQYELYCYVKARIFWLIWWQDCWLCDWGTVFQLLIGARDFLLPFSRVSRQALGPTQPPVQWASGTVVLGINQPVCEADHSPTLSANFKKAWSFTSTPTLALHGLDRVYCNLIEHSKSFLRPWLCFSLALFIYIPYISNTCIKIQAM